MCTISARTSWRVVLRCNNYEVLDLGVMVPGETIISTAVEEEADMIGLSGLITPSLDEMVYVATELQRKELTLPLLIGGATTSRQHTAVRIAPAYDAPTVHVLDASRVANVVSDLLDPRRRVLLDNKNRKEQQELRELHGSKKIHPILPFLKARQGGESIEWKAEDLAVPEFTGRKVLDEIPLGEIAEYIDWTFFFTAWDLRGRFPAILEHERYGEAARDLYEAGRTLLRRIIDEKWLTARAVFGFWPAQAEGEDIVLFSPKQADEELVRFNMLRQQQQRGEGKQLRCLSDFVAPETSGLKDHLGAFACTTGIGIEEVVQDFEKAHDDYSAIMVKALADRLAEALAEMLHQRARRAWGYGREEKLDLEALHAERYRGIRPALGYPACPDHSEKVKLFSLLDAEALGITLTESCAMNPAASVSGLYFAHPSARYFNVGRLGRDQVEDYAKRKSMSPEEVERWLGPNLGYAR